MLPVQSLQTARCNLDGTGGGSTLHNAAGFESFDTVSGALEGEIAKVRAARRAALFLGSPTRWSGSREGCVLLAQIVVRGGRWL